jgi:hypothetical protein
MRYLLNLPLAAAALLQAWFAWLVFMPAPWPGWEDGPSRGAMVVVMLEPALLAGLFLAVAAVGGVFAGVVDWLPARRRWAQLLIVLAAGAVLAVLSLPGVLVAIGTSAAVRQGDEHFGTLLGWAATLAPTAVPLVVALWLLWLVDAPPRLRHAALPRRLSLAALALAGLTGAVLGGDMLREEISASGQVAAREQQMIDERDSEMRAGIARLADTDPLIRWRPYTEDFAPADVRNAALQRLAARPSLEADLAAALQSADADAADFALVLVATLPSQPSAALAAPVAADLARLAGTIRALRQTKEGADYDTYVDRWYSDQLATSLAAARKLAASAGADLRDALADLAAAVAEAYPKSDAAASYPRQVKTAGREIEATLATRRPR